MFLFLFIHHLVPLLGVAVGCAIAISSVSLLLKKQSPCEILTRKTFWKKSVCPHKKNYNPSSGHQPQQTTYKVKKAKEDEPRRSRNII